MNRYLIYRNNGDICYHEKDLTKKEKSDLIKEMKEKNQIGYLSGIYELNRNIRVLVFFTNQPDQDEIKRRRNNGLLYANWHKI
jgi:hypothetical protein